MYKEKVEGVKDCVKFVIKKIKDEQRLLEGDKKNKEMFGHFDDCGEFYYREMVKRESRIEALIEVKISLEKYSKKLKHMVNELLE